MNGVGSALFGGLGPLVYVAVGTLVVLEAAALDGFGRSGRGTALSSPASWPPEATCRSRWALALGCVSAVAGDAVGNAVGQRFGPAIWFQFQSPATPPRGQNGQG